MLTSENTLPFRLASPALGAGEGASLRGWKPARAEDGGRGRGRGIRPSKLSVTAGGAEGAAGGTGTVATLRGSLARQESGEGAAIIGQ